MSTPRNGICLLLWLTLLGAASARAPGQLYAENSVPGCTVAFRKATPGATPDGSRLWVDLQNGLDRQRNCDFQSLAYNNFLYLVGDDGSGHPRFMSWASADELFPESGRPVWPAGYTPLNALKIVKSNTVKLDEIEAGQAGDLFELVDVAGRAVGYDIRVNRTFFDYVVSRGLYVQSTLEHYAADFAHNPHLGGIWLPAGSTADGQAGAIELKTAWRSFGGEDGACPGDVMHCETGADGNQYGLVGMHLVQKTPTHGEFIWASFEHVANSPDCAVGGSNPIRPQPVDPADTGRPIDANRNLPEVARRTGWSFFDYAGYVEAGGDGKSCSFPDDAEKLASTQQCNTDPEDGYENGQVLWRQVDICRTDQLPPADGASCETNLTNALNISCLNWSMARDRPAGVDPKWRFYMLIGTEWLLAPMVPTIGCFQLEPGGCPAPEPPHPCGYPTFERAGSKSLANTTMETWLQEGMAGRYVVYDPKTGAESEQTHQATDCFGCHLPLTTIWGEGDTSHVFTKIRQGKSE